MSAEKSALLGLGARLRLSRALLAAVWTRRGREQLAQGGVERLLGSIGLSLAGLPHEGNVAEPTPEMIEAGVAVMVAADPECDDGYETVRRLYRAMHRKACEWTDRPRR